MSNGYKKNRNKKLKIKSIFIIKKIFYLYSLQSSQSIAVDLLYFNCQSNSHIYEDVWFRDIKHKRRYTRCRCNDGTTKGHRTIRPAGRSIKLQCQTGQDWVCFHVLAMLLLSVGLLIWPVSFCRIIYISRIPPGMGPSKARHILSQYGKIGRVYLQRKDAPSK